MASVYVVAVPLVLINAGWFGLCRDRWKSDLEIPGREGSLPGSLSGFADIGRTHLSAIESGTQKPTLETFFRISGALGVRPSVLLAAIEDEIEQCN